MMEMSLQSKTLRRPRSRLATLIVALAISACGSVDPDAELASARLSFANGDYRTATVHLGNVLQADPGNAEARAIRGRIALAVGDYAAAVIEFREASSRGIDAAAIALDFAESLILSGDPTSAREQLAELEPALSDDFEYWALTAEAAVATRDLDAATAALARAAGPGGLSARGLIVRAAVAAANDDMAAAEATLDTAAAEFPGHPRVHASRAELYLRLERYPEAAAELRQAVAALRAAGAALPQVPLLLSQVQLALATNDPDAAVAAAAALSELAPNSGVSLYADALVEYQAGRFDEAVSYIERAVGQQPDVPAFVTLLGAVQLARGNLGQAEQALQRAIRLAPSDPAPAKLLAETRLRQQRPDAALDALRSLGGLAGSDAQIAYLIGVANLQRGDTRAGLEALEEAGIIESAELQGALIELFNRIRAGDAAGGAAAATALVNDFPDHPQALTAAALFRLTRDEVAQADQLLDRAVAADGAFAPARLLRAERFMQAGQPEAAAGELRAAAEAAPNDPNVKLAQGRLALIGGDADAALRIAAELRTAFPDRSEAYVLEGDAEIARRGYDAAVTAFAAALEHTADWNIRSRHIAALQLAGRDGELLEAYLAAVENDGDNVIALNNASWMLHEAGRVDEALPLAERANTLVPNNPAIQDTLGWILVSLNRERDAIVHLEQAVASAPDAAEIRYHLAVAQARSGRADEARAQLQTLLAGDESFEQRAEAEALLESL